MNAAHENWQKRPNPVVFTSNMWNFLHETDARLFNKHRNAIFYQKRTRNWHEIPVFDDFSPKNLDYAAMPPFWLLLTTPNQFALRFGRCHLGRLKLLRGDQVGFYQWENEKNLKERPVVNLQKLEAKRTSFHCLKVARKEFSHRDCIGKLLQSDHYG